MEDYFERFTVKLAGVPIGIICRFESSRDFFSGYYTDETPKIFIRPDEQDLRRIEKSFRITADAMGQTNRVFSERLLENGAIHALIAESLPRENVLLMHGSCIAVDGEGYIFTAPSGTGKSTHTRLWREVYGDRCSMVDDDKPLLRVGNGTVTAYGTPWNGKHRLGKNTSVPLKAIVWLERGEQNRIRPMTKAESFTVLMKQVYSSSDAETMQRIIGLESEILKSVGFYTLSCNTDREAAVVAYEGMNE